MNFYQFRQSSDSGIDPEIEELASKVIGAAIEVHRHLGPGLPENVYKKALSRELELMSIEHACECPIPVQYKGVIVGEGFIDMLVAGRIVIELKSVESLSPVHRAQLVAYLRATKLELGFLINFNVAILKDGIKRVVLTGDKR